MIKNIGLAFGEIHKKGNKECFVQSLGGNIIQYYIEFDNGSLLANCKLSELQNSIEKSISEFENMPTTNQY